MFISLTNASSNASESDGWSREYRLSRPLEQNMANPRIKRDYETINGDTPNYPLIPRRGEYPRTREKWPPFCKLSRHL